MLLAVASAEADDFRIPQLTAEEVKKYDSFWGRYKSKSQLTLAYSPSGLASTASVTPASVAAPPLPALRVNSRRHRMLAPTFQLLPARLLKTPRAYRGANPYQQPYTSTRAAACASFVELHWPLHRPCPWHQLPRKIRRPTRLRPQPLLSLQLPPVSLDLMACVACQLFMTSGSVVCSSCQRPLHPISLKDGVVQDRDQEAKTGKPATVTKGPAEQPGRAGQWFRPCFVL